VAIGLAAEEHLDIDGDTDDDVGIGGPAQQYAPMRTRDCHSQAAASGRLIRRPTNDVAPLHGAGLALAALDFRR
jgi:hypothetical protein